MTTFIFDVLKDLKDNNIDLSTLTFVLPSKRSGVFLKNELASVIDKTIFAPLVISIEEFVEALSELKKVTNTELLFEFYETYKKVTTAKNIDSFEVFSKWAQILLQDFNEIDRYLIPQKKIFNYLSAIQDIEHWSVDTNQTDFIKNYLLFWNRLHLHYTEFTSHLLSKNIGYQGLIYREAVNKLEAYMANNNKQYVFLGFNALNTSEETIIQTLLKNNLAKVYWDIDAVFLNNPKHDAALFTRQHKAKWEYFKKAPFNWITQNYTQPKNINVYGIPKNIGQAKHVGTLLQNIKKEQKTLNKTAVILGDENLLVPILNAIPLNIDALNITMGFPLKTIPLASLFESLFSLHKSSPKTFYYKDVVAVLSHQFIRPLLEIDGIDYASVVIETINNNNLIYLTNSRLQEISGPNKKLIELLFSGWNKSIDAVLNKCNNLILTIKSYLDLDKDSNLLSLEYLFRFNALFLELTRLNNAYSHIKDISALHAIYKELLSSETLDFQGEPLEGLQVMGMLESRVLDFDTIIISSVNEGVLPSGKSNNSFIPFDVKIENGLPTYKEKDAVYTYHFYRLLQRAKNVHILYNTEADILVGGERSRFITQLELEGIHHISHQIITPQVPIINNELQVISKNKDILLRLKDIAKKGFSPSSLTNYMRNPLDFYYQKVLKIKAYNSVEETVAANTLGTVVHNTLEDFYKPLINKGPLTVDIITGFKARIEERVLYHFQDIYKEGDITQGKNLIIFEIAKRYVSNFLNLEITDIKKGDQIEILAIEAKNKVLIDIPELDFPVYLTGMVDRVDTCNGTTRIIDYKTGKVEQSKVEVVNWQDITTDYVKYSKPFQILCYAYMMQQNNTLSFPVEAGIVSFKNLGEGFLKFGKKNTPKEKKKDTFITNETLQNFTVELKKIIVEICNINVDFIEKEV